MDPNENLSTRRNIVVHFCSFYSIIILEDLMLSALVCYPFSSKPHIELPFSPPLGTPISSLVKKQKLTPKCTMFWYDNEISLESNRWCYDSNRLMNLTII